MDINPSQLVLQLGIAGLLVWAVHKAAMRFIDRWADSEKEKNTAIADGFKAITTSVNSHTQADVASHERLAQSHGDLRDAVVRVESKIDTIADLTPVTGIKRRTPPEGIVAGYYPPQRPKTQGGGR